MVILNLLIGNKAEKIWCEKEKNKTFYPKSYVNDNKNRKNPTNPNSRYFSSYKE